MSNNTNNPISPLISGQLPEFVRIDHPTIVSFLTAYYEWLDQDTEYLRSPKKLKDIVDIDLTIDEFLDKFKNEFLFEFPETLAMNDEKSKVDPVRLAKNIRSFYKAKGTEKTYEFLFRVLYDTGIEFYYPKKDILKLSDGKWVLKKSIKTSNTLGKQVYDSIGQVVYQKDTSGNITASGRVLDVATYRTGIYEVAELTLGGINGEFISGYRGFEFTDKNGNLRKENRIFPVLGEVTITNGGANYRVGDQLVFTPAVGDTGIRGSGRVVEIDSSGAIKKIVIENFGINYKTAPTITIKSEIGSGFVGSISIAAVVEYPGYYANNDGRLSTNKVMQDNKYYQNFSYVLLSEITVDRYRDIVKRLLNPAGMAFFGKVSLKRCNYADLSQATSLVEYDVPVIGHYLPYTFLTHNDLSKWFLKTTVVDGEVQAIIDGYNQELHTSPIQGDNNSASLGRYGVPDGKISIEDYYYYADYHSENGLPRPTFEEWLKTVGNPVESIFPYSETNSFYPPLSVSGITGQDPFWIVYQHPNRRMSTDVVARIPLQLKDEFLTNHGASTLFTPAPTGASGVSGYWKEWTESVTSNRQDWAAGFTGGDRYVMLSYNPLVPFYGQVQGLVQGITTESLTAYRNETTGPEGNPVFLYDDFSVTYFYDDTPLTPPINKDYSIYTSTQNQDLFGPKMLGGKRCYRFTKKNLYEILGETTTPTLQQIVSAINTWLVTEGIEGSSEEYVMLDLDDVFLPEVVQSKYSVSPNGSKQDRDQQLQDMIYLIRRLKESYPYCKFGYYDYPRLPSFVLVLEDLYRSFENFTTTKQKEMAIESAENVFALLKEQDVFYLDSMFTTPSIEKRIVLSKRLLDAVGYANEKIVSSGSPRKRVIICTSRIYNTNSKDTPNFFISSSSGIRTYIQEYSVVKPTDLSYLIGELLDDADYGCTKIDGFYNKLNPNFLMSAAIGSTMNSALTADYNYSPEVFNQDRSTNTDSYKTLIRKSLNAYKHYAVGYTGPGGTGNGFYSATGPTALSPSYWFPLDNKKIDVGLTTNPIGLDIVNLTVAENILMNLYGWFNRIGLNRWVNSPTVIGSLVDEYGSTYPPISNSPEGISGFAGLLLGDLDGDGDINFGDVALALLDVGPGGYPLGEFTGSTSSWYTPPADIQQTVQGLQANDTGGELLGYSIEYSDFRKITARAFFEMPVGREFNCTTDEIKPPPIPQVYAEKINGSTGPMSTNYDFTDPRNTVVGGSNIVLNIESVKGITGTPTEGISSLIYLGYYGIRTLWAELYVVKPKGDQPEQEYLLANAGPFSPTTSIISINKPFPNFNFRETTNEMFTASYHLANQGSFRFKGQTYTTDNHFMRLKLVFRNSANSPVEGATRIMDFNYVRTS